jgi:hypothetical protein
LQDLHGGIQARSIHARIMDDLWPWRMGGSGFASDEPGIANAVLMALGGDVHRAFAGYQPDQ